MGLGFAAFSHPEGRRASPLPSVRGRPWRPGAGAGLTSESESEELELEELDESLELSEAIPVDSCRSTESARTASSGRSCFRILRHKKPCSQCWDRRRRPHTIQAQPETARLRGAQGSRVPVRKEGCRAARTRIRSWERKP